MEKFSDITEQVLQAISERKSILTNVFSYYDYFPRKVANFVTFNDADAAIFRNYTCSGLSKVLVNPPSGVSLKNVAVIYTVANLNRYDTYLIPYNNDLFVVSATNSTRYLYLAPRDTIANSIFRDNDKLSTFEQFSVLLQLLKVSRVQITKSLYNILRTNIKWYLKNRIISVKFDTDLQTERDNSRAICSFYKES